MRATRVGSQGRETVPPISPQFRRVTYTRVPSFYGGPDTPICKQIKKGSSSTSQTQAAPDRIQTDTNTRPCGRKKK